MVARGMSGQKRERGEGKFKGQTSSCKTNESQLWNVQCGNIANNYIIALNGDRC